MTVQTRIYVPLTTAALRRLRQQGTIEPAPLTAFAVTTDLRRENLGADEEQLEYLAFAEAAASAPGAVVVAADVDADVVTDLLGPGASVSAVRVAAAVPRRHIASFHVGSGEEHDYAWYDATELDAVLDVLST